MRLLRKLVPFSFKFLAGILLFLFMALSIQYLTTTIYDFKPGHPFYGKKWYNPYQEIGTLKVRANFHAHSRAWGGWTHGNNSPSELHEAYQKEGYEVHAISNYFQIDTNGKCKNPNYVPAYEHGMNLQKTHCLVLNAQHVSYTDYFLFQTTSHQQSVIEAIKKKGGLIVLAHPSFLYARSLTDMRKLEHYDLIEVLNQFRFSDKHWDEALSAGRLAFLIANDDSHGNKKGQIFRSWTEIFVDKLGKKEMFNALLKGKAVGVATIYPTSPVQNNFVSCQLKQDTICVQFDNIADSILFIGQSGKIKKIAFQTNKASYILKPYDTYIRIKSINAETHVYLNPIVRYERNLPFANELIPKQKTFETWLVRTLFFLLAFLFAFLLFLLLKSKKQWRG